MPPTNIELLAQVQGAVLKLRGIEERGFGKSLWADADIREFWVQLFNLEASVELYALRARQGK